MQVYLILIAMALFMACPKTSLKADSLDTKTIRAVHENPVDSFSISIMTGGGFTGRYSGCTFYSNGIARTWQSMGSGGDSTLAQKSGFVPEILVLRKKLDESVLSLGIQREVGNMTTVVKLDLGDTVKTWSWPGTGVNEKTPEALKTWMASALAFRSKIEASPDQKRK
jgi:hypothetical protein